MAEETRRTLDRSLVQGIAWLGGMKWAMQLFSWCVTLIVAHLLMPEDYGLFGMAMVFIGMVQFVGEAGLLASIVKPPHLDEEVAAQMGGFAVTLGIALMSTSIGIASLIALFFHEWPVKSLIEVLSVTFALRGLQGLPRGLLVRRLEFRRVAWIDAVETLVLTLSTLGYALAGLRYWSLALGVVTGVTASTALCLAWCRNRIAFPRDLSALRDALGVGVHVLGAQLAWYVYTNSDFMIVGRVLGRTALGAYTFAWTIASLAVERVSTLVVRVMPPVFAAVQNDPPAVRRYLCSLTEGLALVTMPACIGLSLVADDLIRTFLGRSWTAAIMPLRLLGVYAMFRCLVAILPQVLIFTGHSRRNMQFSILASIVMPIAFIIGTHWGTTGVAWAWITVYPILMTFTFVRHALQQVQLPVRAYIASLWPALSGTLAMTAVVLTLRLIVPHTLPPAVRRDDHASANTSEGRRQ
jgi:teichuronic acid exporter